jgi:hypothetical protein
MNENNESDVTVLETNTSLSTITKSEIFAQIATAKQYPRDLPTVLKKSRTMALLTEDIAQSCVYALPRSGKTIDGPSVRLAEIVASNFGNLRTGARVISNDGKVIVAQGICHDLETNNCVTVETSRRITDKYGKTYNQDMQTMTGNAACAIAFRNAVFKVIPAALINQIYEDCKEKARGEADKLSQNIDKALAFFVSMGVDNAKVFSLLNVKEKTDITIEMLGTLRGMAAAIKNGESTIKDLFETPSDPTVKADINKEDERIKLMISDCQTIDELNRFREDAEIVERYQAEIEVQASKLTESKTK